MPYLRTAGTAWPTSETGGTTVVADHVKSLRTEVAGETRTTLAPGRNVRDSVTGTVGFLMTFMLNFMYCRP